MTTYSKNWTRAMQREAVRIANAKYRARSIEAAHDSYVELLRVLGGACAICGDTGVNSPLTVDHPKGRNWSVRAVRIDDRVKRYWREYHGGVPLRALCHICNSAGGADMARFYAQQRAGEPGMDLEVGDVDASEGEDTGGDGEDSGGNQVPF